MYQINKEQSYMNVVLFLFRTITKSSLLDDSNKNQ